MRWRTAALVAAGAAGAGLGVLLLGRKVSDRALRPAGAGPPGEAVTLRVHALAEGQVTLTRTTASVRPGRYALEWAGGGHAVVGEVLHTGVQTVTRRLEGADQGTLEAGTDVELTPRVYRGDPTALGLEYAEVSVDGELGPMPAWLMPGVRGTWVVLVHGPGADRAQALPVLGLLNALRLPTLTVTYRGDHGAPVPPDHLSHFGEAEWRDVESAVRFARDSGAGRVLLYGWSLGATMCLQLASRSALREAVGGLVLDSPVLDWAATMRRAAVHAGVPGPLAELGRLAAEGRSRVDPAEFTRLAHGGDLQVPALVLHSPADGIAPWPATARLAEIRPDLVSLHPIPDAEHAALWNADPDRYEEALRRWLTPHL